MTLCLTTDQVPEVVILHVGELCECLLLVVVQLIETIIEKSRKRDVEFE